MRLYKEFVLAALCAAVSTSAWCQEKSAEGAAFTIDTDYPGGNILVEQIDGDTVYLRPDTRGSSWNFYWNFRVLGAEGRTLEFVLTRGKICDKHRSAIGAYGPAVSTDKGLSWSWLRTKAGSVEGEPATWPEPGGLRSSFKYGFDEDDREVRFCVTMPYQEADLHQFIEKHADDPHLSIEEHCKTRKGRSTERLRLGKLDGEPRHRILLTCRHHACEVMASYELEGILEEILADTDTGKWFRRNVEVVAIPFMDKDGVEDGDQGKARKPHDHNRDYLGKSIYPSVRAIKQFVPAWSGGKLRIALDLHCPTLHDQGIFFVSVHSDAIWQNTREFFRTLEQVQTGPLVYRGSRRDRKFPSAWGDVRKTNQSLTEQLPGVRVIATTEFPWYSADGKCVTAESARAFGRDLALAMRTYLDNSDGKRVVENQRQYFGAPRIVGKEDDFCRRAYRVMLKGAAFCKDLYHQWPTEPGCGYIGWGGHGEKDIDANIGMAHLYAMLITFGRYDEQVTGISREEALRRVKGVIRYCCFTHVTGPHTCTDGKHWGGGDDHGGYGHTASWSTVLAHSVWLVWPELDDQTREMAARVIAAEADRFVGVDPPSGKINDTQAESNGWHSRAIAIAAVMFPKHPHAQYWRETSSRWMMNTLSVAADKTDDTVVDGKPVRQWVTTENIHPDFTLENHRIVYPVYMWCSMYQLCQSASYHIFAGVEPPQAAYHHLDDVYEVYKCLQTWEGLPAYVNGSDKFLHLQAVDILIHSFFAQVLNDREAAHLEAVELDILERMQARFTDGRLYPAEEVGPRSRVHNLSFVLGGSYLLHYVRQSNVTPVSVAEFDRRITGVSYFPHGKFVLHRTPTKLVSFAWSKPYRIMGLAIPREGSWLVTPHVRGFVGELIEDGKSKEPPFELKTLDKKLRSDSFTISATALRCDGKVEHSWTFESSPNNDVVMRQKLVAIKPIILKQAETGTIGIGRELGSDEVKLESTQGVKTLGGLTNAAYETVVFPDGQVTVGGRFSYHWTGTGTLCYFNRNRAVKVRGGAPGGYGRIEDRLCVRHIDEPRKFAAGEIVAEGELRIRMLP